MKFLFTIMIMSGSLFGMERARSCKLTPAQQEAYQKLSPTIEKLKSKINALLDQAEENGHICPSDNCPIVNSIRELRISFDKPNLPEAATKQGLLLVYDKDCPLFKLISPGGLHTLAGYYGLTAKMKWDDYDSLKHHLLKEYLTVAPFNQEQMHGDFWQNCIAHKIVKVDGQEIPDLEMGNEIDDSLFYGKCAGNHIIS